MEPTWLIMLAIIMLMAFGAYIIKVLKGNATLFKAESEYKAQIAQLQKDRKSVV